MRIERTTGVVGEGSEPNNSDTTEDVGAFPIGADFEERKKWFAAKLRGLSREECILIAGRVALRVVPVWQNGTVSLAANKYNKDTLHYVVLPILRCQFVVAIASLASSQQKRAFKLAAINSVRAMHKTAFAQSESLASLYANLSVDAANIVTTDSDIDAVNLTIQVIDQAIHVSTLSVPDVSLYPEVVKAVTSAFAYDVKYLKYGSLAMLVVEPLWPTKRFGEEFGLASNDTGLRKYEIPIFFRQSWDVFERLLSEAGDDWDVWAEWFRCVVEGERVGTFLFVLPTQNALTLWRKVALLDDELWNAGPATLNAEFKRLVDEARRESDLIHGEDDLENDSLHIHDSEAVNKIVPGVKSEIGVEVFKNARFVMSQSLLLIRLIQEEIDRIKSNPANDPDTVEGQAEEIAALEQCLVSVEEAKEAVEAFELGEIQELKVLVSLKQFGSSLRSWLEGHAPKHIEHATQLGMVAASTGIISLTGANPTYGLLVSGVIVAKDPVIAMLKAWGEKLIAK